MVELYCYTTENTEIVRNLISILELKVIAEASLSMVFEKSWNPEGHNTAKGHPGKRNYRLGRYTQGDTRTIHQIIDV